MTTLSEEVAELRAEVAAYRLLAVNEGWVHRMVDAYGFAEYAARRIAEVDARARRTIASGYDAQGWLDNHSRAPHRFGGR